MSRNKDEIPQEEPAAPAEAPVTVQLAAQILPSGLAEPRPSVGRIVHFAPPGSMTGSAAIITAVHDEVTVDLVVFQPGLPGVPGMSVMKGDRHAVEQRRWYWPPREA